MIVAQLAESGTQADGAGSFAAQRVITVGSPAFPAESE
jgi:hypothetical protein